MNKTATKYNPAMPSTGYDRADYSALMASNIVPALATDALRFDSAEDASIFFARELDYIKAKSYDKIYPEFTALNHFPITHEVPEGAESTTYYSYEKTGMAAIISNYATDLPRADVKGEPTTAYIKSMGDSYGYSVQEMRASRQAGKSLDTRKAESARYAIDRTTNTIAFAGDKKHNLMGMLSTDNNVPLYTLSSVEVGSGQKSTKWKDKTANQILDDINGMFGYQSDLTQDVERADTLAIPSAAYIDISTRQIPNTGYTVKKFLLENAPYLKDIISAPELAGKNKETNPYGSDVALLYTNDPEKFSLEIPMSFYQYPLQARNLEVVIPCEQRVAGIIMYYPLSALIAVGI
uniref:Major capsid protein n=1 Tax=Myoviridae sp. ct5xZ3 TaxID=2827601 RepID=A0A8S5RS47_9CAUD|nr:MAG TPA: major capsid protein [Myoviridae sp. ct5xZ3]